MPIGECFDLARALLTTLAVANGTCNGIAGRFELDTSASAPGSQAFCRLSRHTLSPSRCCGAKPGAIIHISGTITPANFLELRQAEVRRRRNLFPGTWVNESRLQSTFRTMF